MQHDAPQQRLPLLMRVPPPLLFVTTFLAGVGLQRALPIHVPSQRAFEVVRFPGFALLAGGIVLALSCVYIFLSARTTLIPFGAASKLVTHGPYRITRNPMYVGLALVYAGVAAILTMSWPLLLLPLPVLGMDAIVIPFEENRLFALFGTEFENYCAHVRRWL